MSSFGPWQDGLVVTLHHTASGEWEVVDDGDSDITQPPIYQGNADLGAGAADDVNSGHGFEGRGRTFSTSAPVDMQLQTASDIAWAWGVHYDSHSVNWDGGAFVPVSGYTDPPDDLSGTRYVGYDYSYDPQSPGVSDFANWRHQFVVDYFSSNSLYSSQMAPATPDPEAVGIDFYGSPGDGPLYLDAYLDGYTSTIDTGSGITPSMYIHQYTEGDATTDYWPIEAWANITGLSGNGRQLSAIAEGTGGSTAIDVDWLNDMWITDPFHLPLLSFGWWAQELLDNPVDAPIAGDTTLADYSIVSHADFYITFQGQAWRYVYDDARRRPIQRIFPREDFAGAGRVFPLKSRQSSNRIVGTYL